MKLKEIAKIVNGKIEGNENILIKGVKELSNAKEGDISFLSNPRYIDEAKKTDASCVVVGKNYEDIEKTLLKVEDPYFALLQLIKIFRHNQQTPCTVQSQRPHQKPGGLT